MSKAKFLVSLTTDDNDYQVAQGIDAEEAARRLGLQVEIVHAGNDAITQSQQLLKVIQSPAEERPQAIVTEPVGTGMEQVAINAAAAGIGWAVLNRAVEYLPAIRKKFHVPIFSITTDHKEVGRIQGRQFAALLPHGGTVLYIQGPSINASSRWRTEGMLETKPRNVELVTLRGQWSEKSGSQAVSSWLRLSTSRQVPIEAVCAQNDAMAVGARKGFQSQLTGAEQSKWLALPFLGCDGLPQTGQAWVKSSLLAATVAIPPNTGQALEMLVEAIKNGTQPQEVTYTVPESFPPLEALRDKYGDRRVPRRA